MCRPLLRGYAVGWVRFRVQRVPVCMRARPQRARGVTLGVGRRGAQPPRRWRQRVGWMVIGLGRVGCVFWLVREI